MSNYRRNRVEGGCYFFTVNLRDRRSNLLTTEIAALRTAARATKARHPFHIDAWVVLPDHMHCLWTLPSQDSDFPTRWQMIKATFSRSVPQAEHQRPFLARKRGIAERIVTGCAFSEGTSQSTVSGALVKYRAAFGDRP